MRLCRYPLKRYAFNIGSAAGMLKSDCADVSVSVHIEQGIFIEIPGFGNAVSTELDIQRIGGFEILNFHDLNLRSKNAL